MERHKKSRNIHDKPHPRQIASQISSKRLKGDLKTSGSMANSGELNLAPEDPKRMLTEIEGQLTKIRKGNLDENVLEFMLE